ncbi:hypothetical protein HPULCUR_002243 [Helicostylum pulchrum]|uniref:Uncharacterized protein n=1 Tax=Helicostylum pulchrum TaxID=562976 RepID=A0ABP9XRF7_9FUNG
MSTLTEYININYQLEDFSILNYLKFKNYSAQDRANAERLIKESVDSILNDETTTSYLRDICNSIKEGEFMVGLTKFYRNNQLLISDNRNKQKADEVLDNRSSKRLKSKLVISEKTVPGETIKNAAINTYYNKSYKNLKNSDKNIVSHGFNSILDLSDCSDDGQKKLFTAKEWKELQEKFKGTIQTWRRLDSDIKHELKEIEKIAVENLKEAYVMCLKKQAEYAFTPKEKYFECYAQVLKTIKFTPSFLFSDNKNNEYTEADFVNKLWAPLFESFFRDYPNVTLKWGESVCEDSTSVKKDSITGSAKNIIGDKVDLRIISAAGHDVINVEFARHPGDTKYYGDRRKILRESKNNADFVYRSTCVNKTLKKEMKSLCIQIAGNQGEITETRLKDDGLYISNKIGSLRIPSGPADLKVLRVLLERLDEVKRNAVHISNVHAIIQKDMALKNNSMDKKRGCDVSPNRNDKSKEKRVRECNECMYSSWTRGSWFAPSKSRDIAFAGDLPKYFLSPLPVLSHDN